MFSKTRLSGRHVLLVGLAVGLLVSTGSASVACPSDACQFTGFGVVRVAVNSDSNAGVRLDLNGRPQWSLATVGEGDFQIYDETLQANRLYIKKYGGLGIGTIDPKAMLEIVASNLNKAAYFEITNTSSGNYAVHAVTNGTGFAGRFESRNRSSVYPAISVTTEGAGTAILAETSGSNFAATFRGTGTSSRGVYISSATGLPGLLVIGGNKSAVVATSQGSRALYTEESSEVWFTDYGFGHLENGSAIISIDPLFAETVNLNQPYHVFVQAYGDAEIYVSQRTPTSFEVLLREGNAKIGRAHV